MTISDVEIFLCCSDEFVEALRFFCAVAIAL